MSCPRPDVRSLRNKGPVALPGAANFAGPFVMAGTSPGMTGFTDHARSAHRGPTPTFLCIDGIRRAGDKPGK